MKHIKLIVVALAFLGAMPSIVHAQSAGIEWDTLNKASPTTQKANTEVTFFQATNTPDFLRGIITY